MVLIPFFKRADIPLFGSDDAPSEHRSGQPIPFSEIRREAGYRYGRRKNDPLRSRVVVREGIKTAAVTANRSNSGAAPYRGYRKHRD